MIFFVHVVDGAGNVKWAEVQAENANEARTKVNSDSRGWKAQSYVFEDKAEIKTAMEKQANNAGTPLESGYGDTEPWGNFRFGETAPTGANTFGSQDVNPGFSDTLNPATVWRSFLNRAGGPGSQSGVGMLAQQQLSPVAESLIQQQMNVSQNSGYILPGSGGANQQATLANLLGAGGLSGVTTEAGNIFNLLASGAGNPNIVNPASQGQEHTAGDIRNLAYGALLGQNPQSSNMIQRLIQMAQDRYMEQQRNVEGGVPGSNQAAFIRDAIGANRFDPTSRQY